MKTKPILFNTDMVQAILAGKKTQTRRIIKPQPTNPRWNNVGWLGWDDGHGRRMNPPCEVGDILYVRETWSTHYDGIHDALQFCYKADGLDLQAECMHGESNRWYPSIHMPKKAARIFLRVMDVRVEPLQNMREEDAIAEGFTDSPAGCDSPLERFLVLWNKTIKRDDIRKFGYDANPWVWVISFERCDKPKETDACAKQFAATMFVPSKNWQGCFTGVE